MHVHHLLLIEVGRLMLNDFLMEILLCFSMIYKIIFIFQVNRAPDPSLFHVYHPKECKTVQDISYPSCLRSKALTEGSQLQLGMMLIKLHDGADLEGILSKR